jgi:hypothetical protein
MAWLMSGCGGTTTMVVPPASAPVTKAQAVAYAHTINLRTGDLPGLTSFGSEEEAPKPGRYDLEYRRCRHDVRTARPIASVNSTELSGGKAFYGKVIKSSVEVWASAALVAHSDAGLGSSRSRACLVRFVAAVDKHINRERKGRMQFGPFTLAIVPNPLPGVSHSFLTTINETRVLRTGAIRAHVYRDIFGFTAGAVEIGLEVIGVGHPVPDKTEARALQLLLRRVRDSPV